MDTEEMILTMLSKKWRKFWFEPITTETIAIYRILFGIIALIELLDISRTFLVWFGNDGILPVDILKKLAWNGQPRFDLFLLSPNDCVSQVYFYSLMVAAICLILGLGSRFSAGYLAMGFVSLFNHNPFVFNSGEALLRTNAIFLTLAPAGESYSLDCWIRAKKATKGMPSPAPFRSPWPQRMIQLQLAIAYTVAFSSKLLSPQWRNGDAVYYASRLTELINLPLPFLDQIWFCRALTWMTLLIELAGFTLIWFRPARPYVLLALLIFHICIAYVFFLPIFQLLFIATLVTFLQPEQVKEMVEMGIGLLQNKAHKSASQKAAS